MPDVYPHVKHNFFCPNIPSTPGSEVELSAAESHHATRVLRIEQGATVGLLDGKGTVARAMVKGLAGSARRPAAKLTLQKRRQVTPPHPELHLFIAPPRAKLMAVIVRQATELGVHHILPVICRHSVAKPDSNGPKDRWLQEAVAAIKQSGNPFLPRIEAPVDFEDALSNAPETGIFGHAAHVGPEANTKIFADTHAIALWVGPEAGFTTAEINLFEKRNYIPVQAGPWILRVETAVPALIGWLRGRGLEYDEHSTECT